MAGTAAKSRERLKTLARGMSDKELYGTYGPAATPTIRAARDVGDSEVKSAPPTGPTSGPSQVKKLISGANSMRGLTDTAANAINEKRSRHDEIQRAIDNE